MINPDLDEQFEKLLRRLYKESLWAQVVVVAMLLGVVLWMMFG